MRSRGPGTQGLQWLEQEVRMALHCMEPWGKGGCKAIYSSLFPHLLQVAKVLWWYYFSKLVEFLDTIFFVLRKKTNQITFLHVYHHASMFNIWWCVLNWIPCGQSELGSCSSSEDCSPGDHGVPAGRVGAPGPVAAGGPWGANRFCSCFY